jgi:hypothetical protein
MVNPGDRIALAPELGTPHVFNAEGMRISG